MSKQYPEIARAVLTSSRVPRHPSLYSAYFTLDRDYIGGVNTNPEPNTAISGNVNLAPAALFSYGPHFPAIIEATDTFAGGWWLNESDYHPSEMDRVNAGWGYDTNPYTGRRTRRPTFSPTTRKQLRAIESELTRLGYAPAGNTKTITTENTDGDPTTYMFRLWTKGN
jgi:hypothetical protein